MVTSPSRRDLLRLSAGAGAAMAVGGAAGMVVTTPAEAAVRRLPGRAFLPTDQDTHLLRRATYGPTSDSLTGLRKQGRAGWLARQLDPVSIDDAASEDWVSSRLPELFWSMPVLYDKVTGHRDAFAPKMGMAALARAVWSKRQLLEVMVDFWSNHFNVTTPAVTPGWYARPHYDRTVIRAHALGRFEDMLLACARHPAMLIYLNNDQSTKVEPNENYGRELLELHTVGVDAGYDETDMRNSVLIMTGFGVGSDRGYEYHPADHHVGPVTVMGFSDPNGAADGEAVGLAYLQYLANHPATAQRLVRKLCVRFVSDEPDQALVDRLTTTYLDQGTAIAPVLEELFTSPEFAAAIGCKVRTPMEDVVATARLVGARPERRGTNGLLNLYMICKQLGHAPYAWAQPDGYPDVATSWEAAGATLWRWNRHVQMIGNYYPQELRVPEPRTLLPKRLPRTHGDLVDVLAKRLVFRTLRPEHKRVVLAFLDRKASDPVDRHSYAVTWKLPSLAALILDSPYHGMR